MKFYQVIPVGSKGWLQYVDTNSLEEKKSHYLHGLRHREREPGAGTGLQKKFYLGFW